MKRWALFAVLVLAGCGGNSKPTTFAGEVLTPSAPAPKFSLADQDGRQVSSAAQHGHWFVVTFLYTHCPDVCPLIAANLNAAIASPAGHRAGLQVLAVSVDPKRDTPAAVKLFVKQHRLTKSFHFLIGSRAQLERVWTEYHVAAQPGPEGTITHSTYEMLIDPQGKERLLYDATITAADVTGDLSKLGV